MFGKVSKVKFARILYQTIVSDTALLSKKIEENDLLHGKMSLSNNFTYLSYGYHLHVYEDLLLYKYDPKTVIDVILLCIDEMAFHPTSNQAPERKKLLKGLYSLILENKYEADSFRTFIIAMVYTLFEGQIESLTAADDESLKELFDCVLNHFGQLGQNSKVMQLKMN